MPVRDSGGPSFFRITIAELAPAEHQLVNIQEILGRSFGLPVWSPEGQQLAVDVLRDDRFEIGVISAEGTTYRRVARSDDDFVAPARSPDGQQIAFLTRPVPDTPRVWPLYQAADIYVVNVDGPHLQRITNRALNDAALTIVAPAWSPDGRRIAFLSPRLDDGRVQIESMNVDGSGRTSDIATEWIEQINAFVWSADGQQLAFAGKHSDQEGIFVMGPDGTNPIFILDSQAVSDIQWFR